MKTILLGKWLYDKIGMGLFYILQTVIEVLQQRPLTNIELFTFAKLNFPIIGTFIWQIFYQINSKIS